jgi:hypothetical protein
MSTSELLASTVHGEQPLDGCLLGVMALLPDRDFSDQR